MNTDIYQTLHDAKASLGSLQNERDMVTGGFGSSTSEREYAMTNFLVETGRFMEQLDRNYYAVDNAISELFRLSKLVDELETALEEFER